VVQYDETETWPINRQVCQRQLLGNWMHQPLHLLRRRIGWCITHFYYLFQLFVVC